MANHGSPEVVVFQSNGAAAIVVAGRHVLMISPNEEICCLRCSVGCEPSNDAILNSGGGAT
jgi:hypothetical protein